jgi:PEP-utilising enzyme, mobile domain
MPLEPTWSLVFPRFTTIVVEFGGELSHASILIRETEQTAVINARGAYDAIAEGRRLRLIRSFARSSCLEAGGGFADTLPVRSRLN